MATQPTGGGWRPGDLAKRLVSGMLRSLAASEARRNGSTAPVLPRERARITFPGGKLVLPAQTPYERQQVFEHAEAYTRQHDTVNLNLNRRTWIVSRSNGEPTPECGECGRAPGNISYWFAGRTLCGRCARQEPRQR